MTLRTHLRLAVSLALAVPIAHPQAPPAASAPLPQFDVISVKPNKTTPGGAYGLVTTQFTADGFRGANVPVHTLIQQAYGLREGQVVDEPAWVKTEVFDIEAKVAGPDIAAFTKLNFDQRQAMFQQILTERFKLVAHRETRELPVYALSVAKGGPKFKESPPDPNMIPGGKGPGNFNMGMGRISAYGTAIPYFASMLSRQLGRAIVDRTGLTGNYDFTLRWTPDDAPPPLLNGAPDPSPPPDIFTAVQEQLGLKLESAKAPVDVLVIDHIERPSEN
jgi:uncharacterized protein (TIGR03435 family)